VYRANHGCRTAVKASIAVAAVLAVAEGANLASRAFGVLAGAALVGAVFAACWLVFGVRPVLHPQPQRPREPQVTSPATLAEGQEPARIAA
jgi:hypothetical protein